jgi:7-carboxy-7-deazaguanine synthase
VFVRLTGCPLRCRYCDTAYAFHEGETTTIAAILDRVALFQPRYVCVTGGEPLAQVGCKSLLQQLCNAGYDVSLETSGAIDISGVDARVSRVLDIKTPESGEMPRNRLQNLALLTPHDQVKFVICSAEDYAWSKAFIVEHALAGRCEILFSPSYAQFSATVLADAILRDRLPVRFQIQLHKVLWNDQRGR